RLFLHPLSASSPSLPVSTFFPYTTLFRSMPRILLSYFCLVVHWFGLLFVPPCCLVSTFVNIDCQILGRADFLAIDVDECRNQTTDRKSTRLNSSHVSSSYAVFCLKKKKDL